MANGHDEQDIQIQSQAIELCFHADFVAMPDTPLSLHFDAARLVLYCESPVVVSPRPPGVMVDLGSVHLVPADAECQRMIDEQMASDVRDMVARVDRVDARRTQSLILVSILLATYILAIVFIPYSTDPPPDPELPLSPARQPQPPLAEHVANLTLGITELSPLIFFNRWRYFTLGSEVVTPGKLSTLATYRATKAKLWQYIYKTLSEHEWAVFLASDQTSPARERMLYSKNWSPWGGVSMEHVDELSERASALANRVHSAWMDLSLHVFSDWPFAMGVHLVAGAVNMKYVNVTPADDMFFLTSPKRVRRSALPEHLPPGIRTILDMYRVRFGTYKTLGTSCLVLAQCRDPLPDSAPSHQVVHPVCELVRDPRDTPEDLVVYLETWAATFRGWNLSSVEALDDAAMHFWPNHTGFPDFFHTPMHLAQLKDILTHLVQASATVHTLNINRTSKFDSMKRWMLGPRPHVQEYHDARASAKNLTWHLWHQMHDLTSGIQRIGNICRSVDSLAQTIDDLYIPQNWIVKEDGRNVEMMKMGRPEEHGAAMRALAVEIKTRLGKLRTWHYIWKVTEDLVDESEG